MASRGSSETAVVMKPATSTWFSDFPDLFAPHLISPTHRVIYAGRASAGEQNAITDFTRRAEASASAPQSDTSESAVDGKNPIFAPFKSKHFALKFNRISFQ